MKVCYDIYKIRKRIIYINVYNELAQRRKHRLFVSKKWILIKLKPAYSMNIKCINN